MKRIGKIEKERYMSIYAGIVGFSPRLPVASSFCLPRLGRLGKLVRIDSSHLPFPLLARSFSRTALGSISIFASPIASHPFALGPCGPRSRCLGAYGSRWPAKPRTRSTPQPILPLSLLAAGMMIMWPRRPCRG